MKYYLYVFILHYQFLNALIANKNRKLLSIIYQNLTAYRLFTNNKITIALKEFISLKNIDNDNNLIMLFKLM
jgi:hypothetical protein